MVPLNRSEEVGDYLSDTNTRSFPSRLRLRGMDLPMSQRLTVS